MPLARFYLYSQGIDVWVAPTLALGDGWVSTMRHIARENRMYVVGVNPCVRVDRVPNGFPDRDKVWRIDDEDPDWVAPGNTVIVDPLGQLLAGPARYEETILYAEVDPGVVQSSRRYFDPTGHYNRPDVFRLAVDTKIATGGVRDHGRRGRGLRQEASDADRGHGRERARRDVGRQGPAVHGHDVLNVDNRHDGAAHGQCLLADLADYGQASRRCGLRRGRPPRGDPGPRDPAAPPRRSGSTRCRRTTCSRRPRRTGSSGSSGRRARRSSACRSTRRRRSRPSTRRSSRGRSRLRAVEARRRDMAGQFARRTGIPFVGLRISNIMEPDDYAAFPSYWDDLTLRRWNLWGYVDCAGRRPGLPAGAHGGRLRRRGRDRRRRRHGDAPSARI